MIMVGGVKLCSHDRLRIAPFPLVCSDYGALVEDEKDELAGA